MPKIAFSDIIGIAGIVLAVVLIVLDKAGKLKGHWLFILLGVAALMTLFIALGNSWVADAPERWRIWRGSLLFCITAFAYSGIALWIVPVKPQPPEGGRESLTIGDQVKVAAKPAPAIKTEVIRTKPQMHGDAVTADSETSIGTIKITDEGDNPLKGVEVLFIRQNGTHLGVVVSDRMGIAKIPILTESLTLYCANDGFYSYQQKNYNPFSQIRVKLERKTNGGSVIFTDGTGYIDGLSGRLNPILDTLGRTYLYAENIAIAGGRTQPVDFVINHPLTLEDSQGHKFEIEVVAIIGTSSLLEYRRL